MWAKIITIKRTKDFNYFSLCAMNLFNKRVSQFQLNYWNKWIFPRHSNLLRCTYIYSALLCIAVHPKRCTIMWGGLSSTTTSVQHPLGWCDGCHRTTAPVRSPHTSYRWREERVIEPIKWMGIIRRPWFIRASGGNLARTPGLHPTQSAMGFLMTTESDLMRHFFFRKRY